MPFSVDLKRPDLKGDYVCQTCGKVFCHSSSLSRHRIKNHAKDYSCTLCPTIYESYTKLRQHMSADHQVTKIYMCQCCNNGYKDKSSLYAHTRKANDDKNEENDDNDDAENGAILPGTDSSANINVSPSLSTVPPFLPKPNNAFNIDVPQPVDNSSNILADITSTLQMAALGMMLQNPGLQDYINYINAVNALQTSQNMTIYGMLPANQIQPPRIATPAAAAVRTQSMPQQHPISRVYTPPTMAGTITTTPSTSSPRHLEAMSRLSQAIASNPIMMMPPPPPSPLLRMTPSPRRSSTQSQLSGLRLVSPLTPTSRLSLPNSRVASPSSSTGTTTYPSLASLSSSSRKRGGVINILSPPSKISRLDTSTPLQSLTTRLDTTPLQSPSSSRVSQVFSNTPPEEGLLTPKSVYIPPTDEDIGRRNRRKAAARPRQFLSYDGPDVSPLDLVYSSTGHTVSAAATPGVDSSSSNAAPVAVVVSSSSASSSTSNTTDEQLFAQAGSELKNSNNDVILIKAEIKSSSSSHENTVTQPDMHQHHQHADSLSPAASSHSDTSESRNSSPQESSAAEKENKILKEKFQKIETCVSMIMDYSKSSSNLHPVISTALKQIKDYCSCIYD